MDGVKLKIADDSSDEEEIKEAKQVTFKLHKGAAGLGRAETSKLQAGSGTGRVTRSSVGKTRSGTTFPTSGDINISDVTSQRTKSVLKSLSGPLTNPEVTAALEQDEDEKSKDDDKVCKFSWCWNC